MTDERWFRYGCYGRKTEITAVAAIELVSKLDPTGGFGAFHGSWFANRANKVGV
jgi:hypothetical protein